MSNDKRQEMLEIIERTICQERQSQYGNPENSFGLIAEYWSTYLQRPINPIQVADMMELLKIARSQNQAYHEDNYIDRAGYAILAGVIAARRSEQ